MTYPHFYDYSDILVELGSALAEVQILVGRLTVHASNNLHFTNFSETHQDLLRDHLRYCCDLLIHVGSPDSVIECQLGYYYGSKPAHAMKRAIQFINSLPPEIRTKLAFENDERWNIYDCEKICSATGTAFVYDTFHHKCWPGPYDYNHGTIRFGLNQAKEFSVGRPLVHIASQYPGERLGKHSTIVNISDYRKLRDALIEPVDLIVEACFTSNAALILKGVPNG